MNKKLFFAIGIISQLSSAQVYNNGGFSTGNVAKVGTLAPVGSTWSELQNNTGNSTESNTSSGFSALNISATANYALADDFVVPPGGSWQISSMDFFAYQTGYTGATCPFNEAVVKVYSSDPSLASAVGVFGDDTTNRFASGVSTSTYRIFNSLVPSTANVPGSTRLIWKVSANTPVTLASGTYWVKFQLKNVTPANGGFLVGTTIPGTRGLPTNNAKQLNLITNAWGGVIDIGNPSTAPDVAQDVAFVVNYTNIMATNEVSQYDNRVQVYPNPVINEFKISNPSNSSISSVEVVDMTGKHVKTLKAADTYNVSDLQKGTYILKVMSNDVTKITKLIKQ